MATRLTDRSTPLKVGDKVWLEGKNLKIPYPSRKFAPKREGPFTIGKVLGPVTYELKLPKQWKIHPVFHASLLTPFTENEFHGPNHLKPPPDIVAGEEEYEVEAILTHRRYRSGRTRYLVKWKGYGSNDNSWEPESNLKNATAVLRQYKKRHKL
jgi:hypothetical protein